MPNKMAGSTEQLFHGKRLLVFAPHPDDDILGCGGSIAKYSAECASICIVYLSSGEAGGIQNEDLKSIRAEEARKAAAVLGIDDLVFMNLPDGRIEVQAEALDRVVALLRQKRPYVLYLPHAADLHRDHLKTNELVMEACRRSAGPWHPQCGKEPWEVAWILAYEIWSPLAKINYVEDITQQMPKKIKALRQHKSQLSDIAYDEAIKGLNRYRGVTTGRGEYCECFELIKAQL